MLTLNKTILKQDKQLKLSQLDDGSFTTRIYFGNNGFYKIKINKEQTYIVLYKAPLTARKDTDFEVCDIFEQKSKLNLRQRVRKILIQRGVIFSKKGT